MGLFFLLLEVSFRRMSGRSFAVQPMHPMHPRPGCNFPCVKPCVIRELQLHPDQDSSHLPAAYGGLGGSGGGQGAPGLRVGLGEFRGLRSPAWAPAAPDSSKDEGSRGVLCSQLAKLWEGATTCCWASTSSPGCHRPVFVLLGCQACSHILFVCFWLTSLNQVFMTSTVRASDIFRSFLSFFPSGGFEAHA